MATTNQYLTNNTDTSTTVWTNAPIALADGGTGTSLDNGTSGQVLTSNGDGTVAFSAGGTVTGPVSAIVSDFALFNNVNGKVLSDAGFSVIPINKGGTGATTQGAALTAVLGAVPLSIANGGTGAATQANALTAILGAAPLSIANGGTGAATQSAALSAILGGVPLPIASGGTGAATQADALTAILGGVPLSTANGGLGAALSPSTVGDMLYSLDGATWSVISAPTSDDFTTANGPVVLTFTAVGTAPTYMAG